MATETDEAARREKFVHHVRFFDAATRYPAPYIGFTGEPGYKFAHHCLPYDAMGFLNPEPARPRTDPSEIRVFVVGDSTMLAGTEWWDTVPGYIEAALRRGHSNAVKVYNFGAVSSCTEQMCSLIWMKLLDLDPDVLIITSGATDAFQPYTFDPRPGLPYNSFIIDYLYTHFYDEKNDASWKSGLDYDALTNAAFDRLTRIRETVGHGTPAWEESVADSFKGSLHKIVRLARAARIPILYLLEPIVVRKDPLDPSEMGKAAPDTLAYLARQYDRFETALTAVKAAGLPDNLRMIDASRILNGPGLGLFYDIVHYDRPGRDAVGAYVGARVLEAMAGPAAPPAPRRRLRDRIGAGLGRLVRGAGAGR